MMRRLTNATILTVAAGVIAVSGAADVSGQAERPIALTGARVIDGTGRPPLERAVLVIGAGTVQAIGGAATPIPAGATRIDVTGKTIIPGLINTHGHLSSGDPARPVQQRIVDQLRLYADYGVTTVYSLGDDLVESVKARDNSREFSRDGSRLYVSGPSLSQPLRGKTPADARALVDKHAAMKVDIIKIHVDGPPGDPNKLSREMYTAVIDQAHKHGLRVASHLYYLDDAKSLVEAGVDVIAHSVRDRDVDEAFIDALLRRNVAYIPTLTRELSVFVYESRPSFFSDPFFLRHVTAYRRQMEQLSDPALMEKTRGSAEAQRIKAALVQAQRNLKRLSDRGVNIALGTDTGVQLGRWQGFFEHTELALMVQAGLTPAQAMVAATSGAARAMKIDGRLGTLQAGKAADFVVLAADPLADISNTQKIESVWIAGGRFAFPAN